jgi:hypothetical protein
MRPQHFFIFAMAIAACALLDSPAGAGEIALQTNPSAIILADAEPADGTPLSTQDFTGGVGQAGGDASAIIIQMAQPTSTSAPSNAPSSAAYVRGPAGH